MDWRIVFTASFVLLSHNAVSSWPYSGNFSPSDSSSSSDESSPSGSFSFSGPSAPCDSSSSSGPSSPNHSGSFSGESFPSDSGSFSGESFPSDSSSSSEECANNKSCHRKNKWPRPHPTHRPPKKIKSTTTTTRKPTTTESTTITTRKPTTTKSTTTTTKQPTTTKSTTTTTRKPTTTKSTTTTTRKPTTTKSTTTTTRKPTTTKSTTTTTRKPTTTEQTTTLRNIEPDTDWGSNSNLSLQQQYCIKGCSIKQEDNPVCGTNDITYKNPSALQCLIICGISVQMKHNGPCSQENNTGQGVENSTPTQQPPTIAPNIFESCFDGCVKKLSVEKSTGGPQVCGSNNVTYKNINHLKCALTCGVDVTWQSFTACPESSVPEITTNKNPGNVLTTSTTNAPKINNGGTTTQQAPTTAPNQFKSCFDGCVKKLSVEKSTVVAQVCGSNNVTYQNIDYLKCALTCGVDVTWQSFTACPESSVPEITTNKNPGNVLTTSTTNAPKINNGGTTTQQAPTTAPNQFKSCFDGCVKKLSVEKSTVVAQVCGSNNVTYQNIEHLKCARNCGVDVTLITFSPCSESSVPPEITTSENPMNVLTTSTTYAPEINNDGGIRVIIDPSKIKELFNNPTTTKQQGSELDLRSSG